MADLFTVNGYGNGFPVIKVRIKVATDLPSGAPKGVRSSVHHGVCVLGSTGDSQSIDDSKPSRLLGEYLRYIVESDSNYDQLPKIGWAYIAYWQVVSGTGASHDRSGFAHNGQAGKGLVYYYIGHIF